MEDYILSVGWKNRPMTVKEYMSFSKGLLQELAKFDSVFEDLIAWGAKPNQKTRFAIDYSDFEDKIFPQLDDEETRFENPDPGNWELTPDSKCFMGFMNSYSNTEKIEDGQITVSISGGSTEDIPGVVNIEFPLVNYPQFYDYNYVSGLLKKVIEFCKPDNGYLISRQFREEIELEDHLGLLPIGWLTYIADSSVSKFLPSDIEREILVTGGTLITLKQELPSVENPEDLASATKIRDILMSEGLIEM